MKKLLCCFLCYWPIILHAQGTGALAKLDKLLAQSPCMKTGTYIRKNPTLYRPLVSAQQRLIKMEQIIHQPVSFTRPSALPVLSYDLFPKAQKQYEEVFTSFFSFKKDADTFLYYRSKMPANIPLPTAETRLWINRIMEQKQHLASLRGLIRIKEPSIEQAHRYLDKLLYEVAPQSSAFLKKPASTQRANRTYDGNEFFLHAPSQAQDPVHKGRSLKPLPTNLIILIFNDDPLILKQLQSWHAQGKLFPRQYVIFTQDAYQTLQLVEKRVIQPDVILTDIVSRHAMGGIGLTQELRERQYRGAILALTGYKEEDINGPLFLSHGFDGVIANPQGVVSSQLIPRLYQAVQHYFYYQELHGKTY